MKHFVFAFGMGLAVMLSLTGCSGMRELSSSISEATGADGVTANGIDIVKNKTTQSEVFKVLGAPSLVFKNAMNGETWVYQRIAVRQSNVGFQAQGNFSAFFPYEANSLSKGGGIAGVGASSQLGANRSSYKSAGLMMQFNGNGCVNSYEFTSTSF